MPLSSPPVLETTHTPVVSSDGGTLAATGSTATCTLTMATLVGTNARLVSGVLTLTTMGTASGYAYIAMPFTPTAGAVLVGYGVISGVGMIAAPHTGTLMKFMRSGSGSSPWASGEIIRFSGVLYA